MVCLITHRDGDKISLEGLTQTIDYLKLLSAIAEHIQPKNFRGPFKVRIKDWFRLHRPCLRELLDGFERALVAAEYEAWLEEHRDQFRDPVRRPHRKARSHESSSSGDDSAFESARHPPSKVSSRGWYSNEAETLVKGLREFQGKDRYSRIMRKYGDVLVGRTTSDLKAKARHIKYGYLLVMERRRIKLDEEAWAWLLSI
ncbi:hypothetical protein KEM55_009199 [Ascosphaera atra]|nr:hypothetical protein KEM55_009199 [Ascosphaera atra]